MLLFNRLTHEVVIYCHLTNNKEFTGILLTKKGTMIIYFHFFIPFYSSIPPKLLN